MSNTNARSAQKKNYTITNAQMLGFIEKLPSLKDNNKNTEFNLPVRLHENEIIQGSDVAIASQTTSDIKFVNIHFSYDFVNDRWFLNDKNIEVIDMHRD
ncbi:MAG: hypothetical protein KA954_07000 [Chitinophagales bacterium]|nr:hypothetical protein [Bacteroidota bacterium]MBP7399316.1 hypothetical protein [Chitinophagales bacterium]MBP8753564.1 hypothetical protein [Chitinophagales bacterium]MBP9187995.1 hypothetical protein [Chitinophagales bacterium]MBP9704558.1 hypothetical protein [Chitinophagales bacterium]